MIKLVTIDLDGTLFDNEKKISEENKLAIKKAKENGCYIVIATGRPYNGVINTLKELNLTSDNDYVILYNGGKIMNVGKNELIHSTTIDGSFVKELYSHSLKENINIHAFRENEDLITPKKNPYTLVEETINKIDASVFDFNEIKDNDKFIYEKKALVVPVIYIILGIVIGIVLAWVVNSFVLKLKEDVEPNYTLLYGLGISLSSLMAILGLFAPIPISKIVAKIKKN